MNRILIEIKNDSTTVKNVDPAEETVQKTVLEYSILQGPVFRTIDPEGVERLKNDLVAGPGYTSLTNSMIYLIFPQSLFHTMTLPRKPELTKIQQYNEHKFETSLIFPYLDENSFSLDVQPVTASGFDSPDLDMVTIIDNEILGFAADIKKFAGSPGVKIIIPFLSLKQFILKNFSEDLPAILLHISGNTIVLASLKGREIASVYSTNFIDIPSIPDIIDSFLLNNTTGRIDRNMIHTVYFSLEDYMVGLSTLVEKWMNIKTSDNFKGLPLGKVSKIPPDLLAEIRNEA